MRKFFAAIALTGVALLTIQPAAHATGDNNPHPKVWVCKYVGQPGDFETLKAGKQPIQVDDHSAGLQVGDDFADGQNHSVVIDIVTPENTDEHNDYTGEATCPTPSTTTTTVAESTTSTSPTTSTVPETSTTQEPTTTTSQPVESSTTTSTEPSTTTVPQETTTSEAPTTTVPVTATTQPPVSSTSQPPGSTSSTTRPVTSTSAAPPRSTPPSVVGPPVTPLAYTGGNPDWQAGLGLGLLLVGFLALAWSKPRRSKA